MTTTPAANEEFSLTEALISSRSNVSPKRLFEPGPSPEQLHELLMLAAAAPDHGELTPWRFIIIPLEKRPLLAEVFGQALLDRDAAATPEQIEQAREKAYRAPLLMVVVACLGPREPDIPALERMVAVGAAIQNLLLGAHAMGFGTGLTSGQAMSSARLRELLQLVDGDTPVCCVNIGTVSARRGAQRVRPDPSSFTSSL